MRKLFFKINLFLARKLGMYKNTGLVGFGKGPRAKVLYKDGAKSISMPMGNAVEYAKIFNGTVVME